MDAIARRMWLIIVFGVLLSYYPIDSSKPCVPRYFGKSSVVCVCNSTYCDTLDPLVRTRRGKVSIYTTSREGDRFKKRTAYFNRDSSSAGNGLFFRLDRSIRYQTITGFGGAFADATSFNIFNISSAASWNLIRSYYSDHGIEFSMGRVPIGGTDFSIRRYTNNPVEGDFNMEKFRLVDEDIHLKIPLIKAVRSVSKYPLRLLTVPWTAPQWLKTTSPFKEQIQDVIKGKPGGPYFKAYAKYIIKFLDAYKKQGIRFWAVSPQNEPVMGLLLAKEFGVGFVPKTLNGFVTKDLGPLLHSSGYSDLNVIVFDEESSVLMDWIHGLLDGENATKYINGVGIHWYTDAYVGTLPTAYVHAHYPNVFLIVTESCNLGTKEDDRHIVSMGDWYPAEEYAYRMIESMKNHVSGWVIWNLALNMFSGPLLFDTILMSEAPIYVNSTVDEFYKIPSFYALGHFSKFIPPDSVRISIEPDLSFVESFNLIAFSRPDGGTVAVIVNRSPWPRQVTIKDEKHGYVTTTLPGSSIQSLVWWP